MVIQSTSDLSFSRDFSSYNNSIFDYLPFLTFTRQFPYRVYSIGRSKNYHVILCTLVTILVFYDSIRVGRILSTRRNERERMKYSTVTTRKIARKRNINRRFTFHSLCFTIFHFLMRFMLIPFFPRHGILDQSIKLRLVQVFSSIHKVQNLETDVAFVSASHSFLSIAEICIVHISYLLKEVIRTLAQRRVKAYAILVSKYLAKLAITQPLLFHARLHKAIMLLRWAKYLLPIMGTCNKLKGHIEDGIRKLNLNRRSRRIFLFWKCLLMRVKQKNALEHAVRRIQYSFRLRRKEKAERKLRYLALTEGNRSRRAADVYERIEKKWTHESVTADVGIALAERVEQERLIHRTLTESDRENICKYEKKVSSSSFLIRPNTLFSVMWKGLAIFCVIIEVSNLVLLPRSQRVAHVAYKDLTASLWKSYDLRSICQRQEQDVRTIWKTVPTLLLSLGMHGTIAQYEPQCSEADKYSMNDNIIGILSRLIDMLDPLIKCVSFADVFISFYTGEIDGVHLVPKSVISRWIFPGILLQLYVNPTMKYIGTVIKYLLRHLFNIGPCHVLAHCYVIYRFSRP